MTEDINILTFDSFIQKIKTIKVYCSNAYKEYKVVKVNKTTLVLRDQRTKTDFEVPAAQIFCAMHELGIENCTVPKMRQYVGTHAAPASAAHKSNTKCTMLFFNHYKIINNIVIKHLLLTVIALCMDTFALATPPPVLQSVHT